MSIAHPHDTSPIPPVGISTLALREAAVVAMVLSPDLEILEFNHEAEHLYGKKRQDVLGQDCLELLVPKEARADVVADAKKVLAGEPTKGFELGVTDPSGQERLFLWYVNRFLDEEGNPAGLVAVGHDITKPRAAEDALKVSEARFRQLLGEIDLIAVLLDESGIITFANDCLCRISGWSRDELEGRSWFEVFVPKELRFEIWEVHKKVLAAGDPLHYENEILTKSGEMRLIRFSNIFIKDEAGRSIGSASIGEDITEGRRAETALRESHGLLKAITDGTSDTVFIKDMAGKYLMMNKAGAEASGKPASEIVGRVDDTAYASDEAQALKDHDAEVLGTGKILTFEEEVFGRTFLTKKWPLKDEAGSIIGLIGIARDIEERKEAKRLSDSLNEINASISSTLDLQEIVRQAITSARLAIGCETAVMTMREEDHWVVTVVDGRLSQSMVGAKLSNEQVSHSMEALETRKPVLSDDAYHDERLDPDLIRQNEIRSFLTAPLLGRQKPVGTLAFFHHEEAIAFTATQIDFCGKIAASLSLALENASLYATEKGIAEKLQEVLLRVPEKIEGIEFGHTYRSATVEPGRAGGDFYDLFDLEHDKVGIIIGDVSGKGVEAATVTALVNNTVKAFAYSHDSPAQVMALTNKVVVKETPASMFITLFFATLDKNSGLLTYCNGGHPPPMLKNESRVRLINPHGTVIGVFDDSRYVDSQEMLEIGESLILYTDGAFEARGDHQLFGFNRLVDFVQGLQVLDAREIPGLILQELVDHGAGKLRDDVALLAISRR